jgi:hypothetical protein
VCSFGDVKFAVHAGTTVTFASVVNTVDGGDIGGAVTGLAATNLAHKGGNVKIGNADFAAHVSASRMAAMNATPKQSFDGIEMGGKTFTPGTYRFKSAINIAFGTHVTLDGEGDYIFQALSSLITAADTFFILLNGAKAENVLWALGSSATLGTRSVVEGSILAGSSMSFGAQAELRGCALSQTAIAFSSAGSVNLFAQPSPLCLPTPLSNNVCQNYAIHARTTVTFSAGGLIDKGDVGVSPGTAITVTGKLSFGSGGITTESAEFAKSVAFAHSAAIAHRENQSYLGLAVPLDAMEFTPGAYRAGSAMSLADGGIVTLKGDANSKFLFQAGTTLITGIGAKVVLEGGVKAENVIWSLGSAATLGANSIIQGSIMAGTSITFGAASEVHGCALALAALESPTYAYVYLP